MAKLFTTIFTVALLLSFQLTATSAARLDPASSDKHALKTHDQNIESETIGVEEGEVSCDGLEKEECLMRRTLAAHVDYIYTQKQKP